ncbi:glutamate carboxypeptidase [Sandarakinorhabdus limnophila]|uniref:glutamate carboxypeptidase n=1 Tax=Sandarakinorhabdus limnophila TaxID=210512 RepID=UPI0026F30FF3|nr:glutamate carboxypeptidase [Sandarakinorhabdus limnophila]
MKSLISALLLASATPALAQLPALPKQPPVKVAKPDAALLKAATAEAPAALATLERIVKIESGSYDTEGLMALGNLLADELKARGASVERMKGKPGTRGDIIVGRFTGTGKGKLLLLSHMDTVYTRGQLAETPWRVENGKAYGPGIADDKGGLAVILSALKLLKPADYGQITVAFNTDEEIGSLGSGDLITELARGQTAVLSFEPTSAVPMEGLIAGTSGTNTVTARITGRAAHAGNAPEQGINALVEAANVIAVTKDLDQGQGKRRFNWTQVKQEGDARNMIPDDVTLIGDLRETSDERVRAFEAELKQRVATPSLPGAKVEVTVRINRPAFTADAAGLKLISQARAIYQEAGGPDLFVLPRSGGGTDAAFAARAGVPVLEALGLPGYGYHSSADEYVLIDAIPRRLYLAARLIRELGR